jgi:hypothetical protein
VAVRTAETAGRHMRIPAMLDAVRTLSSVPLDSELTIERTVGAYNKSTVYDCPAGPWVYLDCIPINRTYKL